MTVLEDQSSVLMGTVQDGFYSGSSMSLAALVLRSKEIAAQNGLFKEGAAEAAQTETAAGEQGVQVGQTGGRLVGDPVVDHPPDGFLRADVQFVPAENGVQQWKAQAQEVLLLGTVVQLCSGGELKSQLPGNRNSNLTYLFKMILNKLLEESLSCFAVDSDE